jgi:glycosyltransferase involved in cell wall biosynthesis
MRNGKIDIIIPAYNVKDELLFTCLSSIATQTLRDISKITIVDDASIV